MSSLPFEIISLDLDLTLLDANHQISPRNLSAVQQCQELGAKIIITSGRMFYTTLRYARALGSDAPIIAYNGAYVKRESTDEVLLNEHLDADVAQEIVAYCEREGLHLNYYLDDTLYTAQATPWSDLYAARTGAVINSVGDLRQFANRPPTKVLIIDEPEKIVRLYDEMRMRFAGRAYVTISNIEYLEFMPPTANKGTALSVVAEYYGVPQQKTIAFGDAGNDMPVLQWAGVGVAMENAKPEVKAIADRIAPRFDEDGVAVVLEEIFGLTPSQV